MKLCITAIGKGLDSRVEKRFGRSPYLVIVDTDTTETTSVSNTEICSGRGAGIRAARLISEQGADALLTGIVGPNAFKALRDANIIVFEGASDSDSVETALRKFKNGMYKVASVPSGVMGGGRRLRYGE
jgi:predicted Fe-Mo cluster-binding NifX family protein